jgi:hypothetical protein
MTGATLVTSSGYLTRPSRTRGRHRKQPPPRRFVPGRRLAVGGSAVLLAALVLSVGSVVKYLAHEPVPRSIASPSTPVASNPPRPAGLPASPFAIDDRGFVGSRARCDGGQTAVAIGRTLGSLVVICGDHSGRYGYRGVRLSDDAMLTTLARSTPAHEFIAKNASVTYSISATELRVTVGDAVIKREPMLDYRVR